MEDSTYAMSAICTSQARLNWTERFWTFDDRQAKLAKAQGMKTS
jgi:hypothetical protein